LQRDDLDGLLVVSKTFPKHSLKARACEGIVTAKMLCDPAEKLINIFMGMARGEVRNENLGYHAKVHKQEQESEQRPSFVCLVCVVKLQV
jgi:hypothetical protein